MRALFEREMRRVIKNDPSVVSIGMKGAKVLLFSFEKRKCLFFALVMCGVENCFVSQSVSHSEKIWNTKKTNILFLTTKLFLVVNQNAKTPWRISSL